MRTRSWNTVETAARAVLTAFDGIAPTRAFLEAGLSGRQLTAMLGRGVLERPRKGWFVDPDLPWQVKRAARVGGIAACVTAAALLSLPVPLGSHGILHVGVAANASRLRHNRDRRCVVRSGEDPEVDLHWRVLVDRPIRGCVSVIDALLALAWCVPSDWFVAALDAALHRPRGGVPLLSDSEYVRFVTLLPTAFHPLLGLVQPLSGSPIETLLRLALDRAGIGWEALQFQAHPLHRVDFLLRGRVIVEADGEAFHDPERDALRDAQLAALGYIVVRVSAKEILTDMPSAIARIAAVLEERLAS